MLKEGQKAPAFALPASDGTTVKLKDLAGKTVVLYFYPRDLTPGCTTEAQGFRDNAKALTARNVVVLGVSKDSIESHCKFVAKQRLNFLLLSDPDGKVIEAYDAWGEKSLYGKKYMGILRSTVIIDGEGKILKIFDSVKVEGHAKEVIAAIDAATGVVEAPAKAPAKTVAKAATKTVAKPAAKPATAAKTASKKK